MIKRKKTQNLETIYLTIRDRITLLDYLPGEKLSEAVLAEEFGLSRTPIRTILNRLESEGLVDIRQGVGSFVTAIDIEAMQDVYKLRQELALLLSRLKAHAPDPSVIVKLRASVETLQTLASDEASKRQFAYLNQQIFDLIHSLVDNRPFREIITRLFYQTARVWIAWMPVDKVVYESEAFADEIKQLVAALEINDLETLSHLYRCHIAFGFERLSSYARAAQTESSLPS